MYSLQTVLVEQPHEPTLKYDGAYGGKKRLPAPPLSKHDAIAAVEERKERWMKNVTLSSRDLMFGIVDPKEEFFMRLPKRKAVARSNEVKSLSPVSRMTAAVTSIDPSVIGPPALSNSSVTDDSSEEGDMPRFRQDLIADQEDLESQVQELQTTLQRDDSSSSLPSLEYSESFIASQQAMITQLQHETSPTVRSGDRRRTTSSRRSTPQQRTGNLREEMLGDSEGSRIRIHDQQRVYKAITDGTATLLKCIGCSKHMMATRDIELVYCPGCGTLTPVEMGRIPSASQPSTPDNSR